MDSLANLFTIAGALSAAWDLLLTFLYGFGAWKVGSGLLGLVKKTQGAGSGENAGSNLVWGAVFCGFAYVSGVIAAGVTNTGYENNPFAYNPDPAATGSLYMTQLVQSVLYIVKFFAYLWMWKGMLIWKEMSDGTHAAKTHNPALTGLAHIFFGALLIKFLSWNTLASKLLNLASNAIGGN
ncbi:hypothetical protein E2P84_36725 [Burkholderia cepacia]|uniref:Uncharacterized protein n=1 Tax=Burkholderia cepacia TaxID=292 RepID=A0AAX2RRG0_BURCE|nr:hypothetical protein [Burkholderia cepacia]TES65676.1 hypothetical protein E2P84_36725 [Burkholderia cepacia]TET01668.1 hypothetical protein E3D36_16670 [Burkholderia cepacia]TEU47526.1 hypothetical protein E3D37_16100 [Burkholderia cepacia]TEU53553.1 hypothetical protein E3D38_12490 [Burkholderia cepacia]TEV02159.1 hypothetical protein E3D40_13420 [Burkholderia cepacia]